MTTPLLADTVDAWRTLELGGGTDEFSLATVRLSLDAGYGPVRLARGASGDDQLLIPTEAGRRLPESISSEAVGVKVVQFLVGGRPQSFIEMSCTAYELQLPFRALVDDVLRRLSEGTGPEQSVAAAVAQFRDLLRRRVYSVEGLVGVFGEVHLLNELLALNTEAAVGWTGPLDQRHDFSSTKVCVEVKSTLSREGRIVHISSIDQLQPPSDGRPLFLLYTVLERAGAGGRSVRDLVGDAMRQAADPSVVERALERLHMDDWRTNDRMGAERFAVQRVELFRVDTDFPRLDPDSFRPGCPPLGVMSVQYTLDLGHASAWQLASSDIPAVVQQLAGSE